MKTLLAVFLGFFLISCSPVRESIRQETTITVRDTVIQVVPSVVKDTVSLSYIMVNEDSSLLTGQTEQTKILIDLKRRIATLEVQPPETSIVYRDTTIYQTKTETRIEDVPFISKLGWGALGALFLLAIFAGARLGKII